MSVFGSAKHSRLVYLIQDLTEANSDVSCNARKYSSYKV